MEQLIDVCPVCSAKNIHLLDDMCKGCASDMDVACSKDVFTWVDYYFLSKGMTE